MHPALVRNLRIIQRETPEKVKPAKLIFDRLQDQLINNAHTHTLHDDYGDEFATVLSTYVSTNELDIPPQGGKIDRSKKPLSPSEQILDLGQGKDMTVGIMPGFALPGQGGAFDNERVRQAADLVGHAITREENLTVSIHSLVTSRGGRAGWQWVDDLKENGFSQHALIYSGALEKNCEKNAENPLIVAYGESMGSINALYTAQALVASDHEVLLYTQNPPGPNSLLPSWLKKTQTIAGYLGEAVTRRVFKGLEKVTPKTVDEAPFFHELYADLEKRGIIKPEDSQQRRRKWRATLVDLRNLLSQLPFSTEDIAIPTIINYGWKDPTSFTLERMRLWKKGERESIKGIIKHRLSNFAHTPEYDPMRWVNELSE